MKAFINISLGEGELDHSLMVIGADGAALAELNGMQGSAVVDVKDADKIVIDGAAVLQQRDDATKESASLTAHLQDLQGLLDAEVGKSAALQGQLDAANAQVVDLTAKLAAATAPAAQP